METCLFGDKGGLMIQYRVDEGMQVEQKDPVFQFGAFELSARAGELRKHGIKLKLQDRPVQVLTMLLERAGEVVTREEIQKRLWPENTYVDFENAINSAISKLRDALGDSAENPRFVETLARRGYRFTAPVRQPLAAGSGNGQPAPVSDSEPIRAALRARHRRLAVPTATAVLVAAGIGLALWNSKPGSDTDPRPAVPLTSYPGFQMFPSISPEGTRVVFSWDEPGKHASNLYIKLIGPGEPVRLTTSPAGDFAPAWSPDGHSIAFLRAQNDSQGTVVVMPAIGGKERELATVTCECWRLIGHWAWTVPPPLLAWSADGKWLLAVDQRAPGSGGTRIIVRISVESGEKRTLTSPPADSYGDASIAVSPDGRIVAFTRTAGMLASDLYVMPVSQDMAPTGEAVRLTFDGKEIDGLAWTVDGKSLVFPSSRSGKLELWRVAATPDSRPVRVTAAGDDPTDVAISRTGRYLVYSRQFADENIWRVSLAGKDAGAASSLISSTRGEDAPKYSPDGKRIAFESNRSGSEEIWVSNEDGSDLVQLTSSRNGWAGSPRWAPDGGRIAFDSNAAGNWDIYVISSHGGKPTRLTRSQANEVRPSWSRDGKWIYYGSSRTGEYQIWKMPSSGGAETQVTRNGSFAAFESVDGGTVYYANVSGLWAIPAGGGREVRISESIYGDNFAPATRGVYFIDWSGASATALTVKFLDFRTRVIRAVTSVTGPAGDEMSVSPDERWLLYGKMDRAGSELMVVENFQ